MQALSAVNACAHGLQSQRTPVTSDLLSIANDKRSA